LGCSGDAQGLCNLEGGWRNKNCLGAKGGQKVLEKLRERGGHKKPVMGKGENHVRQSGKGKRQNRPGSTRKVLTNSEKDKERSDADACKLKDEKKGRKNSRESSLRESRRGRDGRRPGQNTQSSTKQLRRFSSSLHGLMPSWVKLSILRAGELSLF